MELCASVLIVQDSKRQSPGVTPAVNNILPRLTSAPNLILIIAKLDKNDLTMFACQFDRYRYARLPSGTAPAGDIFQQKWMKYSRIYPMCLALQMPLLL